MHQGSAVDVPGFSFSAIIAYRYGLVSSCFRCLNSILNAHNSIPKFQVSVAEQASLNQYRLQTPKTWLLIKWPM